jgi:hypothetical protein
LRQHGICSELGQLGGPETDSEDPLGRDPVGVDVLESGTSVETRLSLEGADKDTVWGEEVGNGGSLSKELCSRSAMPLRPEKTLNLTYLGWRECQICNQA